VLESVSKHALGGLPGDELNALDNTIDDDVLNARVFALGVFTDKNGIDIVVRSLVTNDGFARTKIGEEIECATESKVERDVTFAYGCLELISQCSSTNFVVVTYRKRSLQSNVVPPYTVDGILGYSCLTIY